MSNEVEVPLPQLKLKPTLQVSLYGCSSHQYQHSTYNFESYHPNI